MIRYYAYYNHGGYKDFYLGSNYDEDEDKYFLPLLDVHEKTLLDNPNEELSKDVERQKLLPKLIVLSDKTTSYNYPSSARTLMSHSGYKILYRQLGRDSFVLAIRDIPGSLDGYGRKTPYNVMFICDNSEDRREMDIIAEYVRCKLTDFEGFLNTVFVNDIIENGLKVHLKVLNAEISRIISSNEPMTIDESLNKLVRLIVLPTGMDMSKVLREQNISKDNIYACYSIDGALLFKAVKQQQNTPNSLHPHNQTKRDDMKNSGNSKEQFNPSLHAMLNIPKREDIQKLWDYIYKLEKRISNLENNK